MRHLSEIDAINLAVKAVETYPAPHTEHDPEEGAHVVPRDLRHFLARLRLLHGVPFSYLVPDETLLPVESIRFFYLDRAWTDALVQGALSVGTVSTGDRAELEKVYPHVRSEVDATERKVRTPKDELLLQAGSGTITGFLLRSRAVSGWPGMHVRAYSEDVLEDDELSTVAESDSRRMKVLRMERLAPAVLLVLFDGVPAVVHIEEPRQGLQFGVRPPSTPVPGAFSGRVKLRRTTDGQEIPPRGGDPVEENSVPVPFRRGSPGVVDLKELQKRMEVKLGLDDGSMQPHDFALQVLRFPYRQVFGDPRNEEQQQVYELDRFTVTLGITELKAHLERLGPS